MREVRAFGFPAENVAPQELRRASSSLSTYFTPAFKCIDGSAGSDAEICHGISEASPRVQMDFGLAVTVHYFEVSNRQDGECGSRLACGAGCGNCTCEDADAGSTCGAVLRVGYAACASDMGDGSGDACEANLECNTLNSVAHEVTVTCGTPLWGRYAQLVLPGVSRVLSLREVRAFGFAGEHVTESAWSRSYFIRGTATAAKRFGCTILAVQFWLYNNNT